MKKILLMIAAAASLTAAAETVAGVDYEDGIFLLNEGAYGHVHGFIYFRSTVHNRSVIKQRFLFSSAPVYSFLERNGITAHS